MASTTSAKRQASGAVKNVKDDVAENLVSGASTAERKAGEVEAGLARGAEDIAAVVSDTLRSVGVDTDRMVDVAREQATDLQRLIVQEIQDRPLRALGLAAAVGLFVGFLSAR